MDILKNATIDFHQKILADLTLDDHCCHFAS